MNDATVIVFLLIVMLAAWFFLPQLLVKREIPKVIRVFRQNDALTPGRAMTAQELGLAPRSLLQNMFKMRNYKPAALNLLINANIVQVTDEGKVYLDDARLARTSWDKRRLPSGK